MGRGKTREMAFRLTRRAGEAALTPEYQAATTVRKRAKASTATAMPRMVRVARSGCRTVLRQVSLSTVASSQWPVVSGQLMVLYLEDHAPPGFPGPAAPRR